MSSAGERTHPHVPVASLIRPKDGLSLLVEQAHGAGGDVMKAQIAASDLSPCALLLFSNARENGVSVLWVENDQDFPFKLLREFGA